MLLIPKEADGRSGHDEEGTLYMLKAIIIDDEKNAIDALQDIIAEFSQIQVAAVFTNPLQALSNMRTIAFDVVFLDIEMPGVDGLEMAEKIMEMNAETQIVFITAYDQYAVEAFEVNAMDYLLKPVRHERMIKTVEKLAIYSNINAREDGSNVGRISCFGSFQIFESQEKVMHIKWRTNKVKELFAYLIHHQGKSMYKEKIVEDLWPDMEYERSAAYLHTCIYQIRKTIKEHGLDDRMKVTYNNDSYIMIMDGIICDTEQFLNIAKEKREIGQDTVLMYEKAAALYHGHYLEEDDYAWAAQLKQKFFFHYQYMVKAIAEYYMEGGMYSQAILHLQQLILKDPLQEESHEMLLKCHAEMRNRAALVEHYKQMKKLFLEELGIEVKESTKILYEQYYHRLSV